MYILRTLPPTLEYYERFFLKKKKNGASTHSFVTFIGQT